PFFDQGPREGVQSAVIGFYPEIISPAQYLLLAVPVKVPDQKIGDRSDLEQVSEGNEDEAAALVSQVARGQGVDLEQGRLFQQFRAKDLLHGAACKGFVTGVFFL